MNEEDVKNLFKVHQTVRKMLKKRGYIVPDDDMTYAKFKAKVDGGQRRGDMSFIAEKHALTTSTTAGEAAGITAEDGESTEKIYVFLADESESRGALWHS